MKYNLKQQEDPYFCIPACLQAILEYHNLNLTQKEIARRINCMQKGVFNLRPVQDFMETKGFRFYYVNWNEISNDSRDTFLEINKDEHILVCIPNNCDGRHGLLLEDFKDPLLYVIDPMDVKIHELDLYKLTNQMRYKNDGGFGLVSKLE
ncbi:MAG: cysteine peptidase family C39 domain-containing protein [Candidatus Nanoarchaeia archaeon]|nr:cysteine peptidase family C39 domain-containing protein [Candidatus Nanoarchaeia archaeon]MDD5587644.1 cysteine peptidase family C39 domain-containing protein [Candidatus Nanoarchaeia archaeon]